ncbi:MAG TPA: ABC transporter permease subunit [Burkholderiales bacterium]|jgi:ABC-type nitrate/sulfonate/bicarbonate transport system permease component|nr:ABC transporter permease subunit [Burkholderiales bacterium]
MLIVWYTIAASGLINSFLLPPPIAVMQRLAHLIATGDLFIDTAITVYRTFVGFAIAVAIGAAIGFWIGTSRFGEWLLSPIVSFLFSTPKISFLPIFVLWFGALDGSKILMTAFICAFPVISACHSGAKDVNRLWRWVGQNIGMSRLRIMQKIVVPATLPALLTGSEISLPFAFISVSVSEMMAGGGGLGARMMLSARFADSATVVAVILVLGVVGLALSAALTALRRGLLRWHIELEVAAA